MASCVLVQDPVMRVRVPSGAVMHTALVDAVRTMARRRAIDDALGEQMASMTGAAAAVAESSNPAMLELTVHQHDAALAINVAAVTPNESIQASAKNDFEAHAASIGVPASIDAGAASAEVRFSVPSWD